MALGLFFGLLTEIFLYFCGGILIQLVLGDQVVHVLSLGELLLVHAVVLAPVGEDLPMEHSSELL